MSKKCITINVNNTRSEELVLQVGPHRWIKTRGIVSEQQE